MPNLFLVRYPDAPIPATPRRAITIGRARKNTVVLAENRVSRSHAVVKMEPALGMYCVTDLDTPNGTYHNGVRIPPLRPSHLENRDKIRIASTVFTVRIVDDPSLIKNEFKEFKAMAETQATVVASREELFGGPALSGRLEHLCPLELFQMLDVAQKTGVLTLKSPGGTARFSIVKGRIAVGEFGENRGEEAVYAVLNCSEGAFDFKPRNDMTIDHPQIDLDTTALLMEGCRRLDEALSRGGE